MPENTTTPSNIPSGRPASDQQATEALTRFAARIHGEFLPAYCASRGYDVRGFKSESISVTSEDAQGCMDAIDLGLVQDLGGGRFVTQPGQSSEPLFWEHERAISPRPITLWHEPVISFATLACLHRTYGWPRDHLVNQPGKWAFDLGGRSPGDPSRFHLLVEVKKSRREVDQLLADFLDAASGKERSSLPDNSLRKWEAVQEVKPRLVWLVGPHPVSIVLRVEDVDGQIRLVPAQDSALAFSEAR